MKIKNVHIKNFRSIKNEILEFPDNGIVSLIGPNNAGKSNFLRAIDLVMGDSYASDGKLEDYDFYCGDKENEINIRVNFSDSEQYEYFSFEKVEGEYKPMMKYRSGEKKYYLSNSAKDGFPCTYLSAERSISKDTAFTKWSLMGKISKSFNKAITDEQKVLLQNHFDAVKTVFSAVDSFSNFERDFKNFFSEMQSDSPYKLNVDFKPFTPNNYFKTINILAKDPNVDGDIDLEQLGDGAKNLAIISLLRSYAKNFRDASGIIAIEEPEIYLHPQARKHLFEVLKDIANSGLQVIFTTHDPNFLDIGNFESIKRVYKIDDIDNTGRKYSKIKTVKYTDLLNLANSTGGPAGNTEGKVKNHYQTISNFRLTEGFFSSMIILGEGPTEEMVIPYYFDNSGFPFNSKGISVLGAGGKGEIPKFWRLFHSFGIPVICLFDSDNSKPNKVKGNELIATCFGKIVSDITDDISSYKEIEINGGKLVVLEQDFEYIMKTEFLLQFPDQISQYDTYINTINELAPSKQMRALLMAKELFQNHNFIPSFISILQNSSITPEQVATIEDAVIPF